MAPGDDQDIAEAFDEDKLDDDVDEPVDQLRYPPDRPLGATDPTRDDLVTDSAARRDARTQPDPVEAIGHADAATVASDDAEPAAPGRLVEPGADDDAVFPDDVEPEAIGDLVADEDDLSAEEAAIHIERD